MEEDETIIALFFQRDERAIQALDAKYGRLCAQLSHRIVNDRQDAQECVNDAYFALWNAIPPERPRSLAAYLCKTVRNCSLKYCERKTAAKRSSVYDMAMEEIEPWLPGPETVEEALAVRELTRLIKDFLDTLPVENRVIFMRRYAYLDSYQEIADRVGLSTKAVSVRLTRLRRKLKDHLEKEGAPI